jgi:mRNA-degrading endonuclease toxin of MazEF toxin-antitoxin module
VFINQKSLLALFMPIPSHAKGYPFKVALPLGLITQGVILGNQIKLINIEVQQINDIPPNPKKAETALTFFGYDPEGM